MCSICGFATKTNETPRLATVVDMLRQTRHRGPDGCGAFLGGQVVHAPSVERLAASVTMAAELPVIVAQSRLAITGDENARQPFVSRDGGLALVHNGEAYNHEVLANVAGVPAESGCDSEVLMRVLEHHYGTTEDITESVRRTVAVAGGMYALAATDGKTLVLARDAIGKKPLYFVDGPTSFAFASERKALVAVARDQDAEITRLAPGELLTLRPGARRAVIERAEWLSPPAIDIDDPQVAVDAYEAALERAVARRTRGLKRAAVYFSGGVDSVLVTRLLQRAGVDVSGYVAGMEGSSDVEHAVAVAREMDLPLHTSLVDVETVARDLPKIIAASELHGPLQVEVSIPMWYAAQAAHADGHKVVFSGQAADEIFGGYDWYRGVYARQGALELHHRLWADIRALPLDTLEREDRISMAWSLEARCPFLDPDVIRTAMRISPHLKVHGGDDLQRKHPHRAVALRVGVPDSIAYREKVPAQDGANVHDLLQRVANAHFPEDVPHVPLPDFGSNYRYRDDLRTYGTTKVCAMLARIVEEGELVVARQDGSAVAPEVRTARRELAATN